MNISSESILTPRFSRETIENLPVLYRAIAERLVIKGELVISNDALQGAGNESH